MNAEEVWKSRDGGTTIQAMTCEDCGAITIWAIVRHRLGKVACPGCGGESICIGEDDEFEIYVKEIGIEEK